MSILRKFGRDTRGEMFHNVAFAAGAIAIASIAGTHLLDRSLQTGALQQMAGVRPAPSQEFQTAMANIPRPGATSRESIRQVGVDYTPTGSIPANLAQPIILDPCTGIRK